MLLQCLEAKDEQNTFGWGLLSISITQSVQMKVFSFISQFQNKYRTGIASIFSNSLTVQAPHSSILPHLACSSCKTRPDNR